MARSTTPRSGTRRKAANTMAKAKTPTKRAAKAAAPAADATPPAPAPAPVAAPKTRAKAAAKSTTKTKAAAPARAARAKTAAAKPKTALKASAKPRAKPAETTRTAKAKAAVVSTAGAIAAKLPEVKVPKVKLPDVKLPEIPEVTPKRAAIGAGLLAGIGAAVFLWRSTRADQPDYTVVEQDGDFEIREYPALTTAATTSRGPQIDARSRNFTTLADYIFAKSRPGEKLPMTAPVTLSGSATDGWTMRFIMPKGKARTDLPPAPQGVTLESHPPRRVGAIRFGGSWSEELLERKTNALRSWLQLKGYPHEAKAEHAAYNSPMMPAPLRRNEMLVTLSEG